LFIFFTDIGIVNWRRKYDTVKFFLLSFSDKNLATKDPVMAESEYSLAENTRCMSLLATCRYPLTIPLTIFAL